MSSHLASLSEDPLTCPLCGDVFSDPVTTPCGHNFCKACLGRRWDGGEPYRCPTCNKRFCGRPETSTNTAMQEMSVQAKRRRVEVKEEPTDGPVHVTCDVCTYAKARARRSCLVCLTSYCDAHLEPHLRVASLRRHRLTEPLENLEQRACPRHGKLLEIFCRQEQACICVLCSQTEHKGHATVTVEEEGARQKGNIEAKKHEVKVMIQKRLQKTKEIAASSQRSRDGASREAERGERLFTALITQVQTMRTKIERGIKSKLRKTLERDAAAAAALHQDVRDLQRRRSELEELSHQDDPLKLLQTLQALSRHGTLPDLRLTSDLYVQTLRRAMSHLVSTFQTHLTAETHTELARMRQYKESVSFDGATAGCGLTVTEFGKRLKFSKAASPPLNAGPERFARSAVLGTKGFSSGRHYWEVLAGHRNNWEVGVAAETAARTARAPVTSDGFFCIGKKGPDYHASCSPPTALHLSPRPRRVGVYLDYEGGRASFYDVTEKRHIHSFSGQTFTHALFPYFYLHSWARKSEPLVLPHVEHPAPGGGTGAPSSSASKT